MSSSEEERPTEGADTEEGGTQPGGAGAEPGGSEGGDEGGDEVAKSGE